MILGYSAVHGHWAGPAPAAPSCRAWADEVRARAGREFPRASGRRAGIPGRPARIRAALRQAWVSSSTGLVSRRSRDGSRGVPSWRHRRGGRAAHPGLGAELSHPIRGGEHSQARSQGAALDGRDRRQRAARRSDRGEGRGCIRTTGTPGRLRAVGPHFLAGSGARRPHAAGGAAELGVWRPDS